MTVVLGLTWPTFSAIVYTVGHASVELVMGRYLTPDTVLIDRRQN